MDKLINLDCYISKYYYSEIDFADAINIDENSLDVMIQEGAFVRDGCLYVRKGNDYLFHSSLPVPEEVYSLNNYLNDRLMVRRNCNHARYTKSNIRTTLQPHMGAINDDGSVYQYQFTTRCDLLDIVTYPFDELSRDKKQKNNIYAVMSYHRNSSSSRVKIMQDMSWSDDSDEILLEQEVALNPQCFDTDLDFLEFAEYQFAWALLKTMDKFFRVQER